MRGLFDDASPSDKANWLAVKSWVQTCRETAIAETRAKLKAMGVADPKLENAPVGFGLYAMVAFRPYLPDVHSFAAFQAALAEARPIAETYLAAVSAAQRSVDPGPSLSERLRTRPLGEQMLRHASNWGEGDMKEVPPLTPAAKAILLARIGIAITEQDHANTEWLKAIVEKNGWPTIAEVGDDGDEQAWLMVQHADADPAFQLRALRLMEPLSEKGDVPGRNYAYLYDRVMLKLVGTQHYGTQATCRAGKRVPQPLDDVAGLDKRRADIRLQSEKDYIGFMDQHFGPCPPDPAGRGSTKG